MKLQIYPAQQKNVIKTDCWLCLVVVGALGVMGVHLQIFPVNYA